MKEKYDFIIIGSGFGGAMSALELVKKGAKVLMLEKGSEVLRGPHNWYPESSLELTEHYNVNDKIEIKKGGHSPSMGLYSCVGGPSVFYGGVSFRFREDDFKYNKDTLGNSGATWPISYSDLEPYYSQAEHVLQISGQSGIDPTEPFRSRPFPQKPGTLSDISVKIKHAAEKQSLHPFQLPLAINYYDTSRNTCQYCTTCDTYACAVEAKNDIPTMVMPKLRGEQFTLKSNQTVTEILSSGDRALGVSAYDQASKKRVEYKASQIILSAGAMGSPWILMNSSIIDKNPAADIVGRYLMRHVNAIVYGIYPGVADKEKRFHKQLALMDFYNGHSLYPALGSKIGSLQQMPTPPGSLVEHALPFPIGKIIGKATPLLTGLLAIAEDQPNYHNRVYLDTTKKSTSGFYQMCVEHEYSDRDGRAVKALITEAKKILKLSGSIFHYVHPIKTFSHAVGTLRMGVDPKTSVLDEMCKFRGLDNLHVLDGSFMPTSSAVNPSLTIAANALRVGAYLANKGDF